MQPQAEAKRLAARHASTTIPQAKATRRQLEDCLPPQVGICIYTWLLLMPLLLGLWRPGGAMRKEYLT